MQSHEHEGRDRQRTQTLFNNQRLAHQAALAQPGASALSLAGTVVGEILGLVTGPQASIATGSVVDVPLPAGPNPAGAITAPMNTANPIALAPPALIKDSTPTTASVDTADATAATAAIVTASDATIAAPDDTGSSVATATSVITGNLEATDATIDTANTTAVTGPSVMEDALITTVPIGTTVCPAANSPHVTANDTTAAVPVVTGPNSAITSPSFTRHTPAATAPSVIGAILTAAPVITDNTTAASPIRTASSSPIISTLNSNADIITASTASVTSLPPVIHRNDLLPNQPYTRATFRKSRPKELIAHHIGHGEIALVPARNGKPKYPFNGPDYWWGGLHESNTPGSSPACDPGYKQTVEREQEASRWAALSNAQPSQSSLEALAKVVGYAGTGEDEETTDEGAMFE